MLNGIANEDIKCGDIVVYDPSNGKVTRYRAQAAAPTQPPKLYNVTLFIQGEFNVDCNVQGTVMQCYNFFKKKMEHGCIPRCALDVNDIVTAANTGKSVIARGAYLLAHEITFADKPILIRP